MHFHTNCCLIEEVFTVINQWSIKNFKNFIVSQNNKSMVFKNYENFRVSPNNKINGLLKITKNFRVGQNNKINGLLKITKTSK